MKINKTKIYFDWRYLNLKMTGFSCTSSTMHFIKMRTEFSILLLLLFFIFITLSEWWCRAHTLCQRWINFISILFFDFVLQIFQYKKEMKASKICLIMIVIIRLHWMHIMCNNNRIHIFILASVFSYTKWALLTSFRSFLKSFTVFTRSSQKHIALIGSLT